MNPWQDVAVPEFHERLLLKLGGVRFPFGQGGRGGEKAILPKPHPIQTDPFSGILLGSQNVTCTLRFLSQHCQTEGYSVLPWALWMQLRGRSRLQDCPWW